MEILAYIGIVLGIMNLTFIGYFFNILRKRGKKNECREISN